MIELFLRYQHQENCESEHVGKKYEEIPSAIEALFLIIIVAQRYSILSLSTGSTLIVVGLLLCRQCLPMDRVDSDALVGLLAIEEIGNKFDDTRDTSGSESFVMDVWVAKERVCLACSQAAWRR
jgi:hypothetical protein